MGNSASIGAVRVENHPVRTGLAAGVRVERPQDRKLLVRAAHRKVESFPVVEGVGVVVAANSIPRFVKAVGFLGEFSA